MNTTAPKSCLPIALFFAGISVVLFAYGVAVSEFRLFPYHILLNAAKAAQSLRTQLLDQEKLSFVNHYGGVGLSKYQPDKSYAALTFFSAYQGNQTKAYLMDIEGNVIHDWAISYSAVWPEAPHIITQGQDSNVAWQGLHLYPNGDILLNFIGSHFPYGGGLVKLDKNSSVIWKLPRNTHHDIDVDQSGNIFVLAHNYTEQSVAGVRPPVYDDVVLKVSPEGKVLDEFSVLTVLANSEYRGFMSISYSKELTIENDSDPAHTNGVEVLRDDIADKFPLFQAGDLLISIRNMNLIFVVDPNNREIKWAMAGRFVRQHDPDFLPNGNILLFDNLGHPGEGGASRIIEINPTTQKIMWRYTGTDKSRFFAKRRGAQQRLPNGNTLITDSQNGRIFEVTREKEIVWDYTNVIDSSAEKQIVGLVNNAIRMRSEELSFLKTP